MADALRVLLQSGANPNDRSIDGKTGLHYAVINKHNQVVSILLSDPRIDAAARREAREIAVQKGQKSLIQLFDPEKKGDFSGCTRKTKNFGRIQRKNTYL